MLTALGIGVAAGLLVFLLLMLATHLIVRGQFGHRSAYPTASPNLFYGAYQARYPRVKHTFLSGKNHLFGYLYGAENAGALLVMAHGIGAGHESYIKEILWMVDHGWRVFAYDATGSCESEGKGTVGLVQSALDLDAALTYIEHTEDLKQLPIALMGHSWGGYAVAAVLNFRHPNVKASVSIAGYNDPVEMMMQFAECTMGRASKALYPFAWLENKRLFGKLSGLSAIDGINQSGIPVLLIHGTQDEMVLIDRAAIMAHQDKLENPKAVLHAVDAKGQNGHNSIFYAAESASYIEEIHQKLRQLPSSQKASNRELQEWIEQNIDLALYNKPNEGLLSEIQSFLQNALS